MSLRDEILEQPEALRRQLACLADGPTGLAAARVAGHTWNRSSSPRAGRRTTPRSTGSTSSGVRNGLAVGLATPSVVSLYGADPGRAIARRRDQPVRGVAGHRRGHRVRQAPGAATLAITNDPASPLASRPSSSSTLPPDPSWPSPRRRRTRRRCSRSRGSRWRSTPTRRRGALAAVPGAVEAALALDHGSGRCAACGRPPEPAVLDRCVIVGRGFEYATAREWALKLKELAQVFADPYSSADFRHGPIALVQPGIPVLVLAPSGAAAEGQSELLQDLRDRCRHGRRLGRRGDARARPLVHPDSRRRARVAPADRVHRPGQLFAYHATVARGLDPDAPRYISKVTRTI